MSFIPTKEQMRKYYKSSTWMRLRNRRLEMDNHICQGCWREQATVVHHLTYQHWMREFMYELVSMCCFCHDRRHDRLTARSFVIGWLVSKNGICVGKVVDRSGMDVGVERDGVVKYYEPMDLVRTGE